MANKESKAKTEKMCIAAHKIMVHTKTILAQIGKTNGIKTTAEQQN
jgi:hypothetical protein